MSNLFKKLASVFKDEDRRELINEIFRENMLRAVYLTVVVILMELFALFVNGRPIYYVHWVVIGVIVYSFMFLPIFFMAHKKGATGGFTRVAYYVYLIGVLCSFCALSVFPQDELATINTYIIAIFGIAAFMYTPPFSFGVMLLSVYAAFFIVLPFYQKDLYIVEVLRINAFVMNFAAWFLSRLVFEMKIAALKDKKVIEEKNQLLNDRVIRDSMTSLFNHETSYVKLEQEIQRARRIRYPLSVMMLDIDDFKGINDRLGHMAGDRIIVKVAQILLSTCRRTDIVCRYGGEEFLIIMPDTDAQQALMLAERIGKAVTSAKFEKGLSISVSGGISEYKNETVDVLIGKADSLLYTAKGSGKNRFEVDKAKA